MDNNNFIKLVTSICDLNGENREDWLTIVKIVKSSEEKYLLLFILGRGKEAMNYLKDLLTKDDYIMKNSIVMDVIDYLMDSSPLFFQVQLSSKTFMTAMLMLLKKGNEYQRIQLQILYLLEKWAKAFANKSDLAPNFNETYKALLNSGCVFPVNMSSNYPKYLSSDIKPSLNEKESKSKRSNLIESELIASTERSKKYLSSHSKQSNNYGDVRLDLNPSNYPQHLRLIVSELPSLLEYVLLDNEMIDNFDYNKTKIDEGIIELTQTIQDIAVNLKKTIQNRITHEKLIGICLGILDDLEMLFTRYESLTKHQNPKKFISCFMSEYSLYNLNINQGNNMNAIQKMLNKKNENDSESEESGEDEDDDDNQGNIGDKNEIIK